MSATTTTTEQIQYVYIPNLVGKQMLRVPVLPCDDITTSTYSTPGLVLNTSSAPIKATFTNRSRETSPTVSIESVSDEE